jgi:Predicted sugar phosphate isomerase involved in capsule formation
MSYIDRAKKTLIIEAQAVRDQLAHLDAAFAEAVELVGSCEGRIVVMGLGKSGLVGRKIAATMSSVGVPAVFLHPADCLHGDIGMIMPADIILALSYTGETAEIKKVLPVLKRMGIKVIAITGRPNAETWKNADVVINRKDRKRGVPV